MKYHSNEVIDNSLKPKKESHAQSRGENLSVRQYIRMKPFINTLFHLE